MINVKNLTVEEFEKRIKAKKVICFCAGQGLLETCEKYPILESQIVCIVDNFKHGQTMKIHNYTISIISIDELKDISKDVILLITSIQYAKQIIIQLDELKYMDGFPVYIPNIFTDEIIDVEISNINKIVIPKKIHYCWFGKSEIPIPFQKNIETWKKYCPDYEIIQWNESNYDVSKSKYIKQAYEVKKWGFVPDYARLDIINTYGGIYLDTDVELVKPLDNLLAYELFCGFESRRFVAFGLGFGGKANHPILQEMMNVYDETEFIKEDGTLNLTPSPIYQTNILLKYGLIQNGQCQKHDNYVVFSKEYFAPINAYGFGNVTKNTYSIHQYAATWFNEEQKREKEKIEENYKFVMERIEKGNYK